MKKLFLSVTVALTLLFLLHAQAAMEGVRQGLLLWGGRVLPALFPCFVCLHLLLSLGFFHGDSPLLLPLEGLFALTAGAPTGAKLLKARYGDGSAAAELCPALNAVSPAFLLGTVALGQYGVKSCFYPLALGQYTAVLVCLLLTKRPKPPCPSVHTPPLPFGEAFSQSIASAMESMLHIGGCLLLCSALNRVLGEMLSLKGLPGALLAGLLEVSGGCAALKDSGLPLRLQLSLCALFTGFGGLCIGLQSLCFVSKKPWLYLLKKLAMGLLSALVCYLSFPLFVPQTLSAVFSPGILPHTQLAARASAMVALGLSMGTSLLFTLVCACCFKKRRA